MEDSWPEAWDLMLLALMQGIRILIVDLQFVSHFHFL